MPTDTMPICHQRQFWNEWNASEREEKVGRISLEQGRLIISWLEQIGRKDLSIIDVGCGSGWLCGPLTRFGKVTGTDLSDQVLARAAQKFPQAKFIPGDFFEIDFGCEEFDVVVSVEMLSHVTDQQAFLDKISYMLKPGGYLMLATQNGPVLSRNSIPPARQGQIRRWVDRKELELLLERTFAIEKLLSITPNFNRGLLRVLNSRTMKRVAEAAGFGKLLGGAKKFQEDAWLGWTLAALARKPSVSEASEEPSAGHI